MNYLKLLPCLLLLLGQQAFAATETDRLEYIEKFKRIAVLEMERTGIPASIKLAQGILESDGGNSYLAKEANNHFGIKCGPGWKGDKLYKKDDDRDSKGNLIESCFRVYSNAEESYIAHSQFLTDPNKRYRYGDLFKLSSTDYKGWARGLKSAGYATSSTYASKLIRIVETYELHEFDRMSAGDFPEGPSYVEVDEDLPTDDDPSFEEEEEEKKQPTPPKETINYQIGSINDVLVAIAVAGETAQEIADRTGVSIERILSYNEGITKGNQRLKAGEKVYLERKRNFYRGDKTWHVVAKGETMYSISQQYGVKLEKLYERNLMPPNSEPAVGEKIRVRGRSKDADERPTLKAEIPVTPIETLPDLTDPDEDTFLEEDSFEEDPFEEELPVPDLPKPTTPPKEKPTTEVPPQPEPLPQQEETGEKEADTKPLPKEETTPQPVEPPVPSKQFHTVIAGDTLYSLSRRYNTSVDQIKTWNSLKNNTILPGQKLRVQ